jgi:hypothetical protein
LLGRRRYIRPARLFLVPRWRCLRRSASLPAPILVTDDVVSNADSAATDIAKDIAKDISKEIAKDMSRNCQTSAQPVQKFDEGENGGDLFNVPGFTMHVDRDFNLDLKDANLPWTKDLKRRLEHFNKLNRQEKSEQVFLGVVRYGPYAMFVLMPAFALLQLVAYFGRGRRYPDRPSRYAEHLVFAAHTHAFLFLVGVLALSIPVTPVRVALAAWCVLYGLWATKKVYRGRWSGLLLRGYVVAWLTSRCSRWSSSDCCWSRSWCASDFLSLAGLVDVFLEARQASLVARLALFHGADRRVVAYACSSTSSFRAPSCPGRWNRWQPSAIVAPCPLSCAPSGTASVPRPRRRRRRGRLCRRQWREGRREQKDNQWENGRHRRSPRFGAACG